MTALSEKDVGRIDELGRSPRSRGLHDGFVHARRLAIEVCIEFAKNYPEEIFKDAAAAMARHVCLTLAKHISEIKTPGTIEKGL